MDRRGKILNAQLNKKYRKLGSAEIPITDMLFGNDLKVACANIDTISKMGLTFSQSNANKSQIFFHKTHPLQKIGTGIGDGVQEKPGHPEAE